MPHRFSVGQTLELSSAPWHSNRPKGTCKVLACLPYETGPAVYRVQCINERNERVVEETDLSPGTTTQPSTTKSDTLMSIAVVNRR